MLRFTLPIMVVPFGLVVTISGFHPGGLGPIPRMGTILLFFLVVKAYNSPDNTHLLSLCATKHSELFTLYHGCPSFILVVNSSW